MTLPRAGVGRERGGFTVLETIVGLLLGLLLASLALGTLAAQRRTQQALTLRAEILEAVRITRYLLGEEARASRGGGGALSVADDSLALRSFRGGGVVCPGGGGGAVLEVRPRGVRLPQEGLDSVVLIHPTAAPVALLLVERGGAPGGCRGQGGEGWERWTLSAPAPAGAAFARYFRRGSYHLRQGALRYSTGASGRQPLTPEVLDTRRSRFAIHPRGARVSVVPAAGDPWSFVLSGAGGG